MAILTMAKTTPLLSGNPAGSLSLEELNLLHVEMDHANFHRIRAVSWFIAIFTPLLTLMEATHLWPNAPKNLPFPVEILWGQLGFGVVALLFLIGTPRQVPMEKMGPTIRWKYLGMTIFFTALSGILGGLTQPIQPGLERFVSFILVLSAFVFLTPGLRVGLMSLAFLTQAICMVWVVEDLDRLRVMVFTSGFWALVGLMITKMNYDNHTRLFIQRRKLLQQQAELEQQNAFMEKLSYLDGLTNVPNRRYFDEALQREWRRASREMSSLCLVMLDIDHFKKFNDHYQHQAGDECLKAVAKALAAAVDRPADVVARYGGEEFAIILPSTNLAGGQVIAEWVQKAVRDLAIPHAASPHGIVTASIGLACTGFPTEATAQTLLSEADRNLYHAKERGRNQICVGV